MVQCLGLGAFTAVAQVQSLSRELRSREPHSMAKNKQTNKQTNMKGGSETITEKQITDSSKLTKWEEKNPKCSLARYD